MRLRARYRRSGLWYRKRTDRGHAAKAPLRRLWSPVFTVFRLAGNSIRAANRPAEGPVSSDLGEVRRDAIRRVLLAPLPRERKCAIEGTPKPRQGLPSCPFYHSYHSPQARVGGRRTRSSIPTAVRSCPCALPCTNPTFRRTQERFCGCARASTSKRISSSRLDFLRPTAPSAAPGWIISMPL